MEKNNWASKLTPEMLKARASLLKRTRAFFDERGYIEVQTPLLCQSAATDLHLNAICVTHEGQNRYLQTSPEFAMKRLLAQHQMPIYQISHAFRANEIGHKHNPEFWMIEWYRPGWDYFELMAQTDEYLQAVGNILPAEKIAYGDLFQSVLEIDPFTASDKTLVSLCSELEASVIDRSILLDFLFSTYIEPTLGQSRPVMVYDYPAESASLSKLKARTEDKPPVAMRFEVYYKGLELGNGYDELLDPVILSKRFKADNQLRALQGLPVIPEDEYLLSAMQAGLPQSAGIALGIDRLLMSLMACDKIEEVISFSYGQA